jgi:hypothetical protein
MHAVVWLEAGRSIPVAGLRMPSTALLLCAAALGGCASAGSTDLLVARASAPSPAGRLQPQMQVSASSLPRLDSTDGATRSSRIDMTLLPTRESSLGPSIAMTSPDARSLSGVRPFADGATSVDLGLHWHYTWGSNYRFDVSAWRRMNPVGAASMIENRESSYGARVEMHLASAPRSGFVADHRFLGLQLESGARITLRKSSGGGKPMIYYRSNF